MAKNIELYLNACLFPCMLTISEPKKQHEDVGYNDGLMCIAKIDHSKSTFQGLTNAVSSPSRLPAYNFHQR